MMKKEKVEIEEEVFYSDFSGKKIINYECQFNKCVYCGKDFNDEECGEQADDGVLCKECTDAGYKFYYSDGGVGIRDKNGKYVNAKWI